MFNMDCKDRDYEKSICVKKRLKQNCDKFPGKVVGNVCKIGKFRMAVSYTIFGYKPKYQSHRLMSPEKFLELAPPRGAPYNQKRIDELKEKIKKKEMDVPYFDVDVDSCQVIDHEGRHRAEASRQLGIKKIPVVLFKKEFDPEARGMFGTKGVHYDSTEKIKCEELTPQASN